MTDRYTKTVILVIAAALLAPTALAELIVERVLAASEEGGE